MIYFDREKSRGKGFFLKGANEKVYERGGKGRDRSTLSLGPVLAVLSMDNVLLPSSQRATRAGPEILPRYACGATERGSERDAREGEREREIERRPAYPIQNP